MPNPNGNAQTKDENDADPRGPLIDQTHQQQSFSREDTQQYDGTDCEKYLEALLKSAENPPFHRPQRPTANNLTENDRASECHGPRP